MPHATTPAPPTRPDLSGFLPVAARELTDPQRDLPRLAKNRKITAEIEQALAQIPTTHRLFRQDAREVNWPRRAFTWSSPRRRTGP